MLKPRKEIENVAMRLCKHIVLNKSDMRKFIEVINYKHGVTPNRTIDILTNRISIEAISDFELFCLMEAFDEVDQTNKVSEYFSEKEIDFFSKENVDSDTVKFPIRIKCTRIREDQYIGLITVRELMRFRNSDLINYNANTQRAMKARKQNGEVFYQISLNLPAINKIKESLLAGTFISNTITLNIPTDGDSVFEYDPKESELVISKIDSFDIVDGYHRYVAMCSIADTDPDFDYTMEIRITNFTETKSKQFIYQEDQKTRMNKMDSDSMNMDDVTNIALERLSQDPTFALNGQILRSGGLLKFSWLANILRNYYVKKNLPRSARNAEINRLVKDLKEKFNYICSLDPRFISKEYDKWDIILTVIAFRDAGEDLSKLNGFVSHYDEIKNKYKEENGYIDFTNVFVRSAEKLIKEVE